MTALALDPTGRIAVTGSVDGIVRAGPVTGDEPHLFVGHDGAVRAVAVSPDGRWIASGGENGVLRWWPMPAFSEPRFKHSRTTLPASLDWDEFLRWRLPQQVSVGHGVACHRVGHQKTIPASPSHGHAIAGRWAPALA